MTITGFECCFCKKSIKETQNDPIDINIILNQDMQEKTGTAANFWAHFDCMSERLHPDVQGYLLSHED